MRFVGVADDERDTGKGREFFRSALSVTAGDENLCGRILRVDLANGVAGLGVGRRGNGASVDDDEFGVGGGRRGRASTVAELALDGGAVSLSGAAAELFNVEGRHTGEQAI